MIPFIVTTGLLIFFLIRPFASIKMHVRDVTHDIAQVSSSERFSRSMYKQHMTLALVLLNGSAVGIEKDMDDFGAERADILISWGKALNDAFFDEEDEKKIILQNFQAIEKASHQIQEYALGAARALSAGDQRSAIYAMNRIDSIIDTTVAPRIEQGNSVLVAEVSRDLPLTVQVLRQISLMPMLDIDRDVDKLSEEFGNSLAYSKMARLVNEHHQRVEDILIGGKNGRELNAASFLQLKKLLESWHAKETVSESDRAEHAFEAASISEMMRLADELDKTTKETLRLRTSDLDRVSAVKIMTDMVRTENFFRKEIDGLISREESEIRETVGRIVKRIDSAYAAVIFISALIFIMGSFGAFALYKSIVLPILRLRHAASSISQGIFETAIVSNSSDEIGELSKTFDNMRQDLRSSIDKLNDEIEIRTRAEHEKEKVIDELRHALAEVKTLSGMLPICSSCKKIRDDKGYWTQVESYVSQRTQAEFTHGYCPECAAKVMEEIKRLKASS